MGDEEKLEERKRQFREQYTRKYAAFGSKDREWYGQIPWGPKFAPSENALGELAQYFLSNGYVYDAFNAKQKDHSSSHITQEDERYRPPNDVSYTVDRQHQTIRIETGLHAEKWRHHDALVVAAKIAGVNTNDDSFIKQLEEKGITVEEVGGGQMLVIAQSQFAALNSLDGRHRMWEAGNTLSSVLQTQRDEEQSPNVAGADDIEERLNKALPADKKVTVRVTSDHNFYEIETQMSDPHQAIDVARRLTGQQGNYYDGQLVEQLQGLRVQIHDNYEAGKRHIYHTIFIKRDDARHHSGITKENAAIAGQMIAASKGAKPQPAPEPKPTEAAPAKVTGGEHVSHETGEHFKPHPVPPRPRAPVATGMKADKQH